MRSPQEIEKFLTAGNAVVTIRSKKTGAHFTYRVTGTDGKTFSEPTWFVGVATDYLEFRYLGLMSCNAYSKAYNLRLTAKSCAWRGAPSFLAFQFLLDQLRAPALSPYLEVRHEGKCGRCGRPLTHPDSIDRGIGPECWEILGGKIDARQAALATQGEVPWSKNS